MKNNKLVKFHIKFFKKYIHDKNDLLFISNLCTFTSILKMSYEKQDINIFLKNYNLELISTEKILEMINNPIENNVQNDLTKYILNFFHIKKDFDIFWNIINTYSKIYNLHTKTKKINYFFDKKYNVDDDQNSIENFMLITELIGEFNNNVKILLIKNYAEVIKFAKDIFLKVELYE